MNPLISEAVRLSPNLPRSTPVVYILRLQSGIPYIGASIDLVQRLKDHATGRAGRTTAIDPPITLLRVETHPTFSSARQRETQLKRWTRAKKEALLAGDLSSLTALSRSTR